MINKRLWEISLKNSNLLLNTLLFLLFFVNLSSFTTVKAQVFDSSLLFRQTLSSSFEKTAIQSVDESARNWSDYSGAVVLNNTNTQIYSVYGYKTGSLSFSFNVKKINEWNAVYLKLSSESKVDNSTFNTPSDVTLQINGKNYQTKTVIGDNAVGVYYKWIVSKSHLKIGKNTLNINIFDSSRNKEGITVYFNYGINPIIFASTNNNEDLTYESKALLNNEVWSKAIEVDSGKVMGSNQVGFESNPDASLYGAQYSHQHCIGRCEINYSFNSEFVNTNFLDVSMRLSADENGYNGTKKSRISVFLNGVKTDIRDLIADNGSGKIENFRFPPNSLKSGGNLLTVSSEDNGIAIYYQPFQLNETTEFPIVLKTKIQAVLTSIPLLVSGSLQINAPEGAVILVNGSRVNSSSATQNFPAGFYTVRVSKDGFEDFVQTFTITAGQTTRVTATLKALAASLRIKSSTPNATLTIDGRAIGSLPSNGYTYQTSSNTTIVVITAPGFKTETRNVNLQAGQLTDLQLNLQPEPTPLFITSSTPNARASVDGVDRGLIPSGGLSLTITASSATVIITAPDYEPVRQDVTRNPSGVTRVTANLERSTGQLVIRSKPNAEVRAYGSIIGETDSTGLFSISAFVGSVTITVQLEGFKTFSRTVTVTRNQTLEVNATLEAVLATLTIQSNTPNARVRIGGEEISIVGGDFRIELTPGTKVVQVIAAGFETQTFSLKVNAGEQIVREVNLTPRAAAPTPAPVTVAPPVSPQPVTTPPPAPVVNTGNAPSVSTKPRDDVYALVIGIDEYRNAGIPRLKTAVTDARRFAAALENPRIGNIAKGNIRVLLNEAATKVDLEGEFTDALGTLKPNQTLIVYFAGHGAPTPDGNSLLLPVDANPNASRLEISSIALPDWARRAEGKRVLFVLDSCFSGQTGTRSLTADATRPVAAQIVAPKITGLVTILGATSSNQSSQENTTGGLFTSALLEGLGGKADANKDGVVALEEAFAYTRIEVSGSTRSTQIPSLNGTGMNLFAFAQNSEVLALANVNARLAKIDVLYKAGKLTVQQYNALSSMIEGMREARELKLFLDGDASMPEDAFLRLLRRGLVVGVPSGTP